MTSLMIAFFFSVLSSPAPAATVRFDVTTYGATRNNDSDDDRPGIQAAINAAITYANANPNDEAVVFFPRGTYTVKSSSEANYNLSVRNKNASGGTLTINGNWSTLISTTLDKGIFNFNKVNGAVIQALTMHHDPLPYFEGTVQSVDSANARFVVRKARGLDPTHAVFSQYDRWGYQLDPFVAGRPKWNTSGNFQRFSSVAHVSGDDWQFTLDAGFVGLISKFEVGDRYKYLFRGGHTVQTLNCSDIRMWALTALNGPCFFIRSYRCTDMEYDDCVADILPGTWSSVNGDGIHPIECDGVTITDCEFYGIADDGIAIDETNNFLIDGCIFENKRRIGVLFNHSDPSFVMTGEMKNCIMRYNGSGAYITKGTAPTRITITGITDEHNSLKDSPVYDRTLALISKAGSATVYQDDFAGTAGDSTTTVPEVSPAGFEQKAYLTGIDGYGRLQSTDPTTGSAGYRVRLGEAPLTDNSSFTSISVKLTLCTPTKDWIMIGFQEQDANSFLNAARNGGPMVQFNPTSVVLRGGTWGGGTVSDSIAGGYSAGETIEAEMVYYVGSGTIDLSINGSSVTNGFVLNHEFPLGTPSASVVHWLQAQFRLQPSAANGGGSIERMEVSIATSDKYVTRRTTDDLLIASATTIDTNESFEICYQDPTGDPDRIGIYAWGNSRYVCAEMAGADPLKARSTAVGNLEKFDILVNGDGTVSFKAAVNSKFVCAELPGADPLKAKSTAVGNWEKFDVIDLDP